MSTHLIERQLFQLGLEQEQMLEPLSRQLTHLMETELAEAMDEILSELGPQDVVWRLPRMEIDLGIIALSDFSTVFAQRFKARLRELMLQSAPSIGSEIPSNLEVPDRYLELLRTFFLYGHNPWWASKDEADYNAMMLAIINLRRLATRSMIYETAVFRQPRRRIIFNLKEDTIYRLFDLLTPDPAQFFKLYVEDLIRVNRYKRIVKEEEQKVKYVLQELILLYLTEHKDTSINQLFFLRQQLLRLSQYYQIPYQTLLKYILRALKANNLLDKKESIGPLIAQLAEALKMTPIAEPDFSESGGLNSMRIFLQHGRFPASGFYGSTAYILNRQFTEILLTQPVQLSNLLFELGKNPLVRRRLINFLSEEGIRSMFRLLAPHLLSAIYAYFQLAEQVMVHTPAINQEKAAYRKTVQELTLKVLVEKMRGKTDDSIFLRAQLMEFALHYGLDYKQLLQMLLADLLAIKKPQIGTITLVKQIRQLLAERGAQERSLLGNPTSDTPDFRREKKTPRKENLHSTARAISQLQMWLEELRLDGFQLDLPVSGMNSVGTEGENLQNTVKRFLAHLTDANTEKQRRLAQALFAWGHKRSKIQMMRQPGQTDDLLPVLMTLAFTGNSASPDAKSYSSFLLFLNTNRSKFTKKERLQLLQRIGQPQTFSWALLSMLLEILEHPQIELIRTWGQVMDAWLMKSPSSAKSKFWHFVALQLISEKTVGATASKIIPDSLQFLAEIRNQPIHDLQQAIIGAASKGNLANWLRKLKLSDNKIYTKSKAFNTTEVIRLSLADLLSFLGEETRGIPEEELEIMFRHRLSNPEEFAETIRNLRHQPGIIELLLENIDVQEAEALFKAMLQSQFADWKIQWRAWMDTQATAGIFRLAPEAMERELLAWSFHFFLMQGDFVPDVHDFSFFLLEKWQVSGQLDQKRIIKLLSDEQKAATIPLRLRGALQSLAFSRQLKPLHISALSKQRELDLLEYWLRFSQLPAWWFEEPSIPVFSAEKLQKILKSASPEIALNLIFAALEGKSVIRWHEDLGQSGRIQLFRIIQPQGLGFDLETLFRELLVILTQWTPAWASAGAESRLFHIFLRGRVWEIGDASEILPWLRRHFGEELLDFLTLAKGTSDFKIMATLLPTEEKEMRIPFEETVRNPTFWLSAVHFYLLDESTNAEKSKLDWNLLPVQYFNWTIPQRRFFSSGLMPMLSTAKARQQFSGLFRRESAEQWMALQMAGMPLSTAFFAIIRSMKLKDRDWDSLWAKWFEVVFIRRFDDKTTLQRLLEALLHTVSDHSLVIRSFSKANATDETGILLRTIVQAQVELSGLDDFRLAEKERVIQYYLQFGTLPVAYSDWSVSDLRRALLELLDTGKYSGRKLFFDAWKMRNSRSFLLAILQPEDFESAVNWIHPSLAGMIQKLSAVLKKGGNLSPDEVFGWKTPRDRAIYLLDLWTKDRSVFADPEILLKAVFQAYSIAVRVLPRLLIHRVAAEAVSKTPEETKVLKKIEDLILLEERRKVVQKKEKEERPPSEPGESLHLYNAGLCLIWPYIGRLFRLLDMVEGNDFKTEELRMRAVQLTQYIATGSQETPEPVLSLNKLLCGMEFNTAVEPFFEISEVEQTMVESMLKGVLQNWNEMQGTSVTTFRDSFLRREGRLSLREGFWELAVEKKAFDVLLTTLPWQIRTIKLAWMPLPLQVIWI